MIWFVHMQVDTLLRNRLHCKSQRTVLTLDAIFNRGPEAPAMLSQLALQTCSCTVPELTKNMSMPCSLAA